MVCYTTRQLADQLLQLNHIKLFIVDKRKKSDKIKTKTAFIHMQISIFKNETVGIAIVTAFSLSIISL